MEIVVLDMTKYLGRGIKVYFKDGTAINFRPTSMVHGDKWVGVDDEGNTRTIRRNNILFVKAPAAVTV
jgi:hypothetical protein